MMQSMWSQRLGYDSAMTTIYIFSIISFAFTEEKLLNLNMNSFISQTNFAHTSVKVLSSYLSEQLQFLQFLIVGFWILSIILQDKLERETERRL